MMHLFLSSLICVWGTFALANASPILPKGKWSEACRRTTNEAGQPINTLNFLSLKGTYVASGKDGLVWTVTSYKDKSCGTFNSAHRYALACEPSPNKKLGALLCTQNKGEESVVEGKWTEKEMVDSAGVPNVLKIYVNIKSRKDGKIELTPNDFESEEGEMALLSRSPE